MVIAIITIALLLVIGIIVYVIREYSKWRM